MASPGAPAFSAVQAEELISHLNEQWHALVKADNLLGPRHALPGVINNLGVIDALLSGGVSVAAPSWQKS
jgi:hypothetical protein